MKKIIPALVAIGVLVGLVCRCLLLGISFEYDELFTAVSANPKVPFSYIWSHYLMVDVHPPLYNFLLWLYNHTVAYGAEWMLRWPSWVCSVIALFLGWKLFPRYLGKTTRYLFILLLSSNFYMLLYAQHARAYAWLVCLAVPFTFLYLQIARCTYKHRLISREVWVWYGILALLLCWSHYFGALLFGLFSVVLFVNAWRYKQSLRWFMIVPTAVLVLFLPWLIPNLIYNLTQHRFSGNWWGNQTSVSWHLLKLWVEFFFTSFKAFYVLLGLGILAVVYSGLRKRKIGGWPYAREIWLLFIPIAIAGIFVWVVSFKIFWLLWRYFMPFVPGLYLLVALVLSPVCKRYFMLFLVFLCFVGLSYNMFFHIRPLFWKNRFFPARGAMEIYKEAFDDKDLYVVALEAFPPESMVPMYSFYPNQYFNMHKKVYELFSMPADEREQLLSRHQTALLWMPNCTADKLNRVIQQWERPLEVFARYRNTCFMITTEFPGQTINESQKQAYLYRFRRYMSQHPQY